MNQSEGNCLIVVMTNIAKLSKSPNSTLLLPHCYIKRNIPPPLQGTPTCLSSLPIFPPYTILHGTKVHQLFLSVLQLVFLP